MKLIDQRPAPPDNQVRANPGAGGRGARARRAKAHLGRALALESVLGELFPSVFDKRQPLPLAIGTNSAIAAALGEIDGRVLGTFFRRWTTRWSYLRALAADGSMRHALDGSMVEPVSDDHRRHVAETLAAMREADRRPVAVDKPKPKPKPKLVQPEASVAPSPAPPLAVSTRNAALPVLRLPGARQ